jgi:translocation and assembly module TamB
VEAIDARVALTGDLRQVRYEAEGELGIVDIGTFDVSASGTGDPGGAITIEQGLATGEAGRASVDGELSWADGFRTDLVVDLERFSVATVFGGWPEAHPVSGGFALSFRPPELSITEAGIEVQGSDARVSGRLAVMLDSQRVEADLEWRNLGWPIGVSAPRLSSDQGQAQLEGSFDDWEADGTFNLASPGLPDGRFGIEARGDRDQASGRIVEGSILGGTVRGTASASWRDVQAFSMDLALAGIRTGSLFPDWPGEISGRVEASGQTSPPGFEARLEEVHGRLRGWPLEAGGRVSLKGGLLSASEFVIRHGDSTLNLDGGMSQAGGLRFSGYVADVGTYADGIAGEVDISGSLARRDGEPLLDAVVQSERLRIRETELSATELEVDLSPGYQALRFRSILDDQLLELAAEGVLDDPEAPSAWEGTLTQLSLTQQGGEEARRIYLVQSASLRVAPDAVTLERACLQGSIEARLCMQLGWVADEHLRIFAELDSIAVNRINQFVDTGFAFDQHVTGELRWDKEAGEPPAAFARLEISPGTVRNLKEEEFVVATGTGNISFDVHDGALLEGELTLPLPGTGAIAGAFTIADIRNVDESAIEGRLGAELTDINAIRVLAPSIDKADGRLSVNVVIGGSVSSPLLTGHVRLSEGIVEYRPIGLRLEDIDMQASFNEKREFDLVGEFVAGEGRGTLTSSGDYSNGLRDDLAISLKGEQLRLVNVPDLTATANADIRVGFDDGTIRLDGSVLVPQARLSPRSLPATRYTESEDVVVVAGELPYEEQRAPRSSVRLDGELTVGLGEDVVVDIDPAEARVTGSVTFTWDDNLVPMANGRYEISGDVEAYGQVLDITEGAVRFPQVPADNPYLRIRAEREIFGNSQVKAAGILVDGRLKDPTVEPYTDPRTTRERALTLLVTGSDFDLEQGVGAIDFGTYIAPRLFVSYGIGLFDQENVISARYDLGKGFGLKATSGQSESGVDLIYHVDR